MKLLRATKARWVFHLASREKRLLLELLKLYPCIPPGRQPLTKSSSLPDAEACQRMLDEALAEQRVENRKQLETLLAAPQRFRDAAAGCEFTLAVSELEWLLQILNDIRVGSWVRLGSPEQSFEAVNEQTAPDWWAMEAAGAFQMQLLGAIEGTGATEGAEM